MGGAPNGATVHMFSDVKRLLTNLTIPTRHTRIESGDSRTHSPTAYSPRSAFSHAYSPTSTTFTPPLTPDSFHGLLLSPAAFSEYEESGRYQYRFQDQPPLQDCHQDTGAQKESKSAYPGLCIREDRFKPYEFLIADVSGNESTTFNPDETIDGNALSDNEWYGLDYTIELSKRDRRGSESTDPLSGGEHSKSRESWAVIRQGTVPPVFEDEDYCTWKRWHRYLDKEQERQRKQKALEFIAHAEDLACIFVEEVRTRDWISWEEDPYFPAHKHNLAWPLKRSRSLGCIRELCPLPALGDDERDWLDEHEHISDSLVLAKEV
ncbi:hypothetical protein HWV62_29074 [Athelia sp. TMB]|nr:hypothetical protein HWV62_29074 [Athelia sp. TMB]